LYAPNFGGASVSVPATNSSDNTLLTTVMTTASGTITGTLSSLSSGEGDFSGFQLEYSGGPEPSTWMGGALLLGAAGLALRQRRYTRLA
jgi:MYXO-CTERM domain-containing protein